MQAIVVFSGGLDSTTMLYDCAAKYDPENVLALTFLYGQRHSIEVQKSKKICKDLGVTQKIVDLAFLGPMVADVCSLSVTSSIGVPSIEHVLGDPAPSTEVPFRNMIFFSIALSLAQATDCSEIWCGIQEHDLYGYFDATPEFVEKINDVAALNRKHQIKVLAPFSRMSKTDEIVLGRDLGVPYQDTWSCYEGPDSANRACGRCATCAERINAFAKAGEADPLPYAISIPWDKLIEKYS